MKKCPKCNCEMVIKSGQYGQFWGCTGFPNCRYTENT
ncbi:topoisomerase DNA-binding C4 zinc finger domain-containing protein [Anaerostipes faecalis]